MRVKLVTEAMRKTIPGQYEQDGLGDEQIVWAVFFTPDSNWTWYVCEMWEEEGETFFAGLVDGHEVEFGLWCLSEMERARGPMGLPIERDRFWVPVSLGSVKRTLAKSGRLVV